MKKDPAKDQPKSPGVHKKASDSVTLPSGRPIPRANPTKPFIKGGSIF